LWLAVVSGPRSRQGQQLLAGGTLASVDARKETVRIGIALRPGPVDARLQSFERRASDLCFRGIINRRDRERLAVAGAKKRLSNP
jgi:hypothetical protein